MNMKAVVTVLLVSVIVTVAAQKAAMVQFSVTNSSTSVPTQITNASIAATYITLIGCSAPQTTNTSTVWVSYRYSANGQQAVRVNPGEVVGLSLDASGGAQYSLSNVWFDVTTANDGLTILYDQVK